MSAENFIDRELAEQIHSKVGTPCYVYSEAALRESAAKVLAERYVIDRGWSEERAVDFGRQTLRGNVEQIFG